MHANSPLKLKAIQAQAKLASWWRVVLHKIKTNPVLAKKTALSILTFIIVVCILKYSKPTRKTIGLDGFQDDLIIWDTERDVEGVIYNDCYADHYHQKYGTIISSNGIKHMTTFVLEPLNNEKLPSRVDEYVLKPQCQIQPGNHVATIYVQSQHLNNFASMFIINDIIDFDFILISGDEDYSIPLDITNYQYILDSPYLIRWHTQNLCVDITSNKISSTGSTAAAAAASIATSSTGSGVTKNGGGGGGSGNGVNNNNKFSKMRHLPIGLDLHTLYYRPEAVPHWGSAATPIEQEKQLLHIISYIAPPFHKRKIQVFCNFHFTKPKGSTSKGGVSSISNSIKSLFSGSYDSSKFQLDRINAETALKGGKIAFYQNNKLSREKSWELQSQYAFVASPHGHGLDCHRTWEALLLGSIPIVKTSTLDPMWKDLPVLIVDDWGDITPKLLQKTFHKYSMSISDEERKKLFYPYQKKLSLKWWFERISKRNENDVDTDNNTDVDSVLNYYSFLRNS
jgi:hypothetical protein